MNESKTRFPFRVLAGVMGTVLLCFSLPVSLINFEWGVWGIVFVASSFIGGMGLLTGAFTGRWYSSLG